MPLPLMSLPLTYDECRARFRRAAELRGVEATAHPIAARGPDEQRLTIDTCWSGDERPHTALVVMSGTHGVEGFIGSALQCELLDRLAVPTGTAVLFVHAVNPWGMAWWRRQNESNVDLNRNWRRDQVEPVHNEAYDQLHPIACPDTAELPPVEPMFDAAMALVAERGLEWVRDGISAGQYRHPDGLHFGGDRTEASTAILEALVTERLSGVGRLLTVDLHTGHGPWGEVVSLCDQPPDSPQHRFLTRAFHGFTVEATVGNDEATTGLKAGQLANGFADVLGGTTSYATSIEFGTVTDEQQLAATYAEQWVHRHGDRTRPDHAAAVWAYRCCFTPDDEDWTRQCLDAGRRVLDDAVGALSRWDELDAGAP